MVLHLMAAALVQASVASSPPAASTPTPASPSGLFDSLFGTEKDRLDSSAEVRAGRDDLNIARVKSGRFTLAEALPIYPAGEGWCAAPAALFDALGIAYLRNGDQLVVTLFEPRRQRRLAAAQLQKSPEGDCIDLKDAGKLVDASISFDSTELEITVEGDVPVPALANLEREESRVRRKGHDGPAAPTFPRLANPYSWASIPTVDVALNASFANGRIAGSSVIEGAGDLFKATAHWRASINSNGTYDISGKVVRVDPDGWLLGPLHARRIEVGDVAMPGQPLVGDSGRGRGLIISTAPEWRADIFDRIVISGPMPAGWHAELTSEARLIGYVDAPDAAGEYRFADIPLKVGANRFVVDLFGPHGEHERRVVERQVGSEQFPENETNVTFGLAIPDDGDSAASAAVGPAAMFGTLRHGVSTGTSLRVDARHAITGSQRALGTSVFASVFGGVGGLSVAWRDPGGVAASAIFARRLGALSLNARLVDFGSAPSAWSDIHEQALRRLASIDLVGPFALGGQKFSFAMGAAHSTDRDGVGHVALKVQGSTRFGQALRADSQIAVDWGERTEALGTLALDWTRGAIRLRGQVAYRLAPQTAINQLSLTSDFPVGRWSLRLGAGYEPSSRSVVATAGGSRRFGPFDLAIDAGWGSGGPRIGASLRFALGDVPGRGIRALPTGASRTAMLAPRMTGQYGKPVAGARFLLANSLRQETTGADGIAILGGISSGRPQNIELQLSSLDDDRLRPTQRGTEIVARPGQILAVPIRLEPTGAIEVRLVRKAGDREDPIAGVKVTALTNSGSEIVAETDFDGYAMFEGVPYGSYTLRASFNGVSAEHTVSLSEAASDPKHVLIL